MKKNKRLLLLLLLLIRNPASRRSHSWTCRHHNDHIWKLVVSDSSFPTSHLPRSYEFSCCCNYDSM